MARRRPIFIWPSSKAMSMPGPALGRPVADGVGAVALDEGERVVGRVAGRLRELLAVGVDDEAGDGGVAPTAGTPCS